MLLIYCLNGCIQRLETIDCSQRMPYLKQSATNIEINLTMCSVGDIPVSHHVEKRSMMNEFLNLSSTSLQHIPDGWFKHFTNLSKLDLHNNSLSELTNKSFEGLTNLKQLDLSSNSFVRLKQGWFAMLNSLETLTMNNCGIQYFEPAQFVWPDRLFDLSLVNNMIPVMPPLPLTTKNDSRWVVHLEGNDINCNCRRQEHTKDTVKMETYCRIHSICLSQTYSKKSDKSLNCSSSRLNLMWNRYFSRPVCSGPFFKIDCNITGKCTVELNAIPEPKQNLSFFDLAHCVSSKNKGVCAFNLEEGSALKCNTNMVNLNSSATNNNESREATRVITTVRGDNFQSVTLLIMCLILSIFSNIALVSIIITCKVRHQQPKEAKENEPGYTVLLQRQVQ